MPFQAGSLKEYCCVVRDFRTILSNKYIREVRDFFTDSVVGSFVCGVSYLLMVLLSVSMVETVVVSRDPWSGGPRLVQIDELHSHEVQP